MSSFAELRSIHGLSADLAEGYELAPYLEAEPDASSAEAGSENARDR